MSAERNTCFIKNTYISQVIPQCLFFLLFIPCHSEFSAKPKSSWQNKFVDSKIRESVLYKVKLKNADDVVLLDDKVYEYLSTDPYLVKVDFINNLRKHSSGCAVFQKTWKKADGGYKTETIYLHKIIAEKFLNDGKTRDKNLVGAKNGNKLDCRLENIVYRSRSVASRKRKTSSRAGYTGVYKENNRYRAVISVNRKSIHIGMFPTAEEAALAYNKKSRELYGEDGKINIIKPKKNNEEESLS